MRVVKGITWVIAVALAALAFARTGHPALIVAALGVALVPLVGWACAAFAVRKVGISLSSATSASKDAPVRLTVHVRNGSILPVAALRFTVRAHNMLTGEDALIAGAAALAPRAETDVEVVLSSALCGRVELGVDDVRAFDPVGIFSCKARCDASRRLTIMPSLHEVYLRDLYAASPLSDTTVFSPYVKGPDLSEVFALREYEPGDELKRIHWKLSEKIDQMIVRDASLPLDNTLLLFWDKGLAADVPDAAGRADAMADVVLSLMEQLARADVAFEVASNDVAAGRCTRAFVTGEADVYEVIGQLLSSPVELAGESGMAVYARFFGALACSRVLYVCAQRPPDLLGYTGLLDVVVFSCDGGAALSITPPLSEISFGPGGARQALEMAGAM